MTHRLLLFLWPCLLLVSCDKPGESSHRKTDAASPARGGHAPREQVPGTAAALRIMLKTAKEIETPVAREKVLADVAWSALEIDPDLASEAFHQLTAGSTEKIRLIQHYAMRLAEQNPDEALAWAATVGTEQEITAAKSQIALVISEADPQRAASLLSDTGIAGHEFDVAAVQVLQRWTAQSAPDAAAWASSFPPGAARKAGITLIVSQWANADAPAAFAWMSALQDESVRQEALLSMEEALLQRPQAVRDTWLQHADAEIQNELEQQYKQAFKEIKNNISLTENP